MKLVGLGRAVKPLAGVTLGLVSHRSGIEISSFHFFLIVRIENYRCHKQHIVITNDFSHYGGMNPVVFVLPQRLSKDCTAEKETGIIKNS
jgi:hypothetical protein